MRTYFTLTLYKNDIIRDFNLNHVYIFNQELAKLKSRFGFAGFYFLYKNVKVFLEPFIREFPLEIESYWGLFNTEVLICYAYRHEESDIVKYRESQRFYPTLNNLEPIFYLPFNWQTKDLVFSTAVRMPSTFSDNNQYQSFSIGKSHIYSFVSENADVVYSNATFAFLNGQRANQPITFAGNSVNVSLATPNNYVNPYTILIIYATQLVAQINVPVFSSFGSSLIVIPGTYNNQNYLSTPDDQVPLTYYLPYPYFANKSADILIQFPLNGVTIYKCFLAEIPIIGNSILFNPDVNSGNFINDLVSRKDLIPNTINVSGINITQSGFSTVLRSVPRRISDALDYDKHLIGPSPVTISKWTNLSYQTNPNAAWINTTAEQGLNTWFNYDDQDILTVDFLAIPTIEPFVHVQASIGNYYLADKIHYANYLSDFPYTLKRDWSTSGAIDVVTGFEETSTSTSFLFTTTFFNNSDSMNDYLQVALFIPALNYRNQLNSALNFRMSAMDTFANGLRTNLINLNHYVSMFVPSVISINFYDNLLTNQQTIINFNLGGLNPILINAISCCYCRVTINRHDYTIDAGEVLNGYIETNMLELINANQQRYEPICYFNGVISMSHWRKTTILTPTAAYYFKIVLDSVIISGEASLNVEFNFA